MTDKEKLEKVIKGLECCTIPGNCGTCQWYPSEDAEEGCIRTLMKATLKLLKVQEPRVMTLDEYRAIAEKPAEERVPVWLEWRGGSGRWTIPERAYQGYGVNWRCWTGKPGEDEREAVKWE